MRIYTQARIDLNATIIFLMQHTVLDIVLPLDLFVYKRLFDTDFRAAAAKLQNNK